MTETLTDEYPEAAPYIQQAVGKHGDDWVLEHYHEHLYPLGRVVEMPGKNELPSYDTDEHDTVTEEERVEMYQAWAQYQENFPTGAKPDE
jgi:hypothetical protein